jgi:hypothetical protein
LAGCRPRPAIIYKLLQCAWVRLTPSFKKRFFRKSLIFLSNETCEVLKISSLVVPRDSADENDQYWSIKTRQFDDETRREQANLAGILGALGLPFL